MQALSPSRDLAKPPASSPPSSRANRAALLHANGAALLQCLAFRGTPAASLVMWTAPEGIRVNATKCIQCACAHMHGNASGVNAR